MKENVVFYWITWNAPRILSHMLGHRLCQFFCKCYHLFLNLTLTLMHLLFILGYTKSRVLCRGVEYDHHSLTING